MEIKEKNLWGRNQGNLRGYGQKDAGGRRSLRGQSLLDYVIIVGVALVIALVALGLLGFWPTVTLDFQTRQAITYWQDQARPITVDAVYNPSTGRVEFALQTQIDEPITLTQLSVDGMPLSLFAYDANPGHVGAGVCNQAACRLIPCTCAISLPPRSIVRVVSEPVSDIVQCGGAKTGLLRPLTLSYVMPVDVSTTLNESGPLNLNIVCPSG